MAKFSQPDGKTPLGRLLELARQRTPDPHTGDSYAQTGVARALRERGLKSMKDRTYASIENENKLVKPNVINHLADILPLSVLEMVKAMGYEISFEGIADEGDAVLLEAYQQASDETRRIVRLALGIETPHPRSEALAPLRRLAAMDRPGRQGNRE